MEPPTIGVHYRRFCLSSPDLIEVVSRHDWIVEVSCVTLKRILTDIFQKCLNEKVKRTECNL